MDKIEKEIEKLKALRAAYKITLNANYFNTNNKFNEIWDKRVIVSKRIDYLQKIKSRKEKIKRIKNKI